MKHKVGDKLRYPNGAIVEVLNITEGFMLVKPVGKIKKHITTVFGKEAEFEAPHKSYYISPNSELEKLKE